MQLRDQNILLFCMIALIRDNQNDATDAWTPSEDALVSETHKDKHPEY